MAYMTKDSGKRQNYSSGMRRDSEGGKRRFDLIIPENQEYKNTMFSRWAGLMERGMQKYGERNWELANSLKEYKRFRVSAFRHFMQWYFNEDDEDHAAAVFFNIMAKEYVEEKLKKQKKGFLTKCLEIRAKSKE